jgi:hypothetical protein
MRRAGDVEHDGVGRIEPDQRREAPAPFGRSGEQRGFRSRIGVGRVEPRMHGARIGQRHAGDEAEFQRQGIAGGEAQRALLQDERGERAGGRKTLSPFFTGRG